MARGRLIYMGIFSPLICPFHLYVAGRMSLKQKSNCYILLSCPDSCQRHYLPTFVKFTFYLRMLQKILSGIFNIFNLDHISCWFDSFAPSREGQKSTLLVELQSTSPSLSRCELWELGVGLDPCFHVYAEVQKRDKACKMLVGFGVF